MGAGDGFLELLAPHLPVGGAEKAGNQGYGKLLVGSPHLPLLTPQASLSIHPSIRLSSIGLQAAYTPQQECQAPIPLSCELLHILDWFVLFSIVFEFLVRVRIEPRRLCALGKDTRLFLFIETPNSLRLALNLLCGPGRP